MSQANSTKTVNKKIGVNDLNENTLIDQPLSLDKIRARCSQIKRKLFIGQQKFKLRPEDSQITRSGLITDLVE